MTILDNNFHRDSILKLREWDEINKKMPIDFAKYRLIRGHFGYRFCQLLSKKPVFMTMLREPINHVISSFNHQKREKKNEVVKRIYEGKNIDQILNDPYEGLKYLNAQVRELSNDRIGDEIYHDFGERRFLDVAKERLNDFAFIGLLEKYQESLFLLAFTFGWTPIRDIMPKNTALESDVTRKSVDEATLGRINELTELDRELYEYGKILFEKRYRTMIAELMLKYYNIDLEQHTELDLIYGMLQLWYSDLYKKKFPAQVDNIKVDFNDVLNGSGWQDREVTTTNKVFRWTGPESTSIMDLPLKRDHDLKIIVKLRGFMTDEILESFRLKVNSEKNGVDLVRRKQENPNPKAMSFEGIIPKAFLRNQYSFTRLIFQIDKTMMPKTIDPKTRDDRLLGVAISEIEIQ